MRSVAGLATTVLVCAAASAAGAQNLTSDFPSKSDPAAEAARLNEAAFAPKSFATAVDPGAALADREGYRPGEGLMRWFSGEARLSGQGAATVDSLRVSVGGAIRTPGGLPLTLGRGQWDPSAYEVEVTRDWPAALSYEGKAFGVDLTPHAGVGMSSLGGQAEAGARVEFSKRASIEETAKDRLKALGLTDGGARFGDRGRWYLFAAASGRAVGLNMLHSETGWDRAGWTQDAASTLIGDAQVGVGWRKGPMQSSLGYIHREVKGQHMIFGQDTRPDDLVAFSLSIRPRK